MDDIGLEGNQAANELVKKGAEMPLYILESLYGIGKGFMVMILGEDEEQLKERY